MVVFWSILLVVLAPVGMALWHALFQALGPVSHFVPCVFKMITHLPCATCGGTRAFVTLGQGLVFTDGTALWRAWQWFPLGVLAWLGGVLWVVMMVVISPHSREQWLCVTSEGFSRKAFWGVAIELVAIHWGVQLLRAANGWQQF